MLQLDLTQRELQGVVDNMESVTATEPLARGSAVADDDSDGKLVGSAIRIEFDSPDFGGELNGLDFGLRTFDCGPLSGCSGHGRVSCRGARCCLFVLVLTHRRNSASRTDPSRAAAANLAGAAPSAR